MKLLIQIALLLLIVCFSTVENVMGQTASHTYVVPETTTQQPVYPITVKTNVLFDLAGVPNLGVELPVGRHFSAGVDVAYADWQYNKEYTLQTSQINLDVNYWFNPRQKVMSGWFAGAYALYSGPFDVQWKDGYQGNNLFTAGISAGYSLPLSTYFAVELAVAGGYVYSSEVRHYHLENKHPVWQETRYNFSTLSLTKLQVNLVWHFNIQRN